MGKRYYVGSKKDVYNDLWRVIDRNKNEFDNEIAFAWSRGEARKVRDALNMSNDMHDAVKKVIEWGRVRK